MKYPWRIVPGLPQLVATKIKEDLSSWVWNVLHVLYDTELEETSASRHQLTAVIETENIDEVEF